MPNFWSFRVRNGTQPLCELLCPFKAKINVSRNRYASYTTASCTFPKMDRWTFLKWTDATLLGGRDWLMSIQLLNTRVFFFILFATHKHGEVCQKKRFLEAWDHTDGQQRKPGFPFHILKQAGGYFYIKFQLLLAAHLSMIIPEF